MAGTFLNFPFNEELFDYKWRNEPDPVMTALINSGAVQANADIQSQISMGSDLYTVPFYKTIGGTPANYDGKTDVPIEDTAGAAATGVVYGRSQGWREKDFVVDFNSKADPMGQIATQVGGFWSKYRQKLLIKMLEAAFASTTSGKDDWKNHITDIASSSASVAKENKLNEGTVGDAIVKACGDMALGSFGLAVMHSVVANNLAKLDLLEYRKYTDPLGIQRQLNIADINGLTVVIDDGVPVEKGSSVKYTTYLLGNGAIQYATAPVSAPVELARDAKTAGGQTELITRIRETMLINGFTWKKETSDGASPSDEVLANKDRYSLVYDPKCVALAKIVSNG